MDADLAYLVHRLRTARRHTSRGGPPMVTIVLYATRADRLADVLEALDDPDGGAGPTDPQHPPNLGT